jgi:hypothetical protein
MYYIVKDIETSELKTFCTSKPIQIGDNVNVGTGSHVVIQVLRVNIFDKSILEIETA